MQNTNITGRFAPSPSGRMHLGNIFAALMSYASAKSRGGRWLLRIEDLDRQRCRREYALQLIDDLEWLGLRADEGPTLNGSADSYGAHGPYFQSERDDVYDRAFNHLQRQGLVYECFCRRQDLTAASAPHASDGQFVYAGTCRNLSEGRRAELRGVRKPAMRLRLPDQESIFTDGHYGPQRANLATDRGDIIVRRADGNYAYQLAVAVDDALMGVTEVVRANDLLSSAHEQTFVFNALGYPAPSFCHFPLLAAPDGNRLSKRDKSLAMDQMRSVATPQEIVGIIANAARLQDEPRPMEVADFVRAFCWDRIPTQDIVVDAERLFG